MKMGLNKYMTDDAYHGDVIFLSSSTLKDILENPMDYKRRLLGLEVQKETSYFVLGNYVHQGYLEPEKGTEGFATFDGVKRVGKIYKKCLEDNPNCKIMRKSEMEDGDSMVKALFDHRIARTLNVGGIPEQTICGTLEGIPIKVRPDYILNDQIVDLKTTSMPIDAESLRKIIFKYNYHLSAALYMDIANQHLTNQIEQFTLVFINKKTNDIAVCKLGPNILEEGRQLCSKAIAKYKRLKQIGYFEADYEEDVIEIDI